MPRKYAEKIRAKMVRVIHDEEVLLLRTDTLIQFGNSSVVMGSVMMTNPGSFDFKHNQAWEAFKNGKGDCDVFEAEDYPDLSMQNVIEVLREGFQRAGRKLEGVVPIYNLSNVVQPNGKKAEDYHELVKDALTKKQLDQSLLISLITSDLNVVSSTCGNSDFILAGFVKGVFEQRVRDIEQWFSLHAQNKLVVARDKNGTLSHPRRWRTEPNLKEKAIDALQKALTYS